MKTAIILSTSLVLCTPAYYAFAANLDWIVSNLFWSEEVGCLPICLVALGIWLAPKIKKRLDEDSHAES